jgi:hypothetical protein
VSSLRDLNVAILNQVKEVGNEQRQTAATDLTSLTSGPVLSSPHTCLRVGLGVVPLLVLSRTSD